MPLAAAAADGDAVELGQQVAAAVGEVSGEGLLIGGEQRRCTRCPASMIAWWNRLLRLTQTRTSGGTRVTEETAVAVIP